MPEESDDFEAKRAAVEQLLKDRIAKLEWSLHNIEEAIKSCLTWKEVQHEAILLQANLYRYEKGMKQLLVQDWERENLPRLILVDPKQAISEQIKEKARRGRKMQRGLQSLAGRKAKIEKSIGSFLQGLEELKAIANVRELERFRSRFFPTQVTKILKEKKLPYRCFRSASGLRIFVGKGAKGNGVVSFTLASGSDLWCHVQGCPGAHVVLKVGKGKEPDNESVLDALQLALIYSKAQGKGEVMLSQAKYVRPLGKKEAGKVQVSKHSLCLVECDLARFQAIKERAL